MEELKTNVSQIYPPLESEENNMHLKKNGMQMENQEAVLDDRVRINVVEEGHANTKKVNRFYFVKFWPSNLEVRIEEAKKLLGKTKQDILQISRDLQWKMVYQDQLVCKLKGFYYGDSGLRETLGWKREKLNALKQNLDKLCFANNAYRGRASKSCSSKRVLDIHKGEFDDDLLQQTLDKLYSEKQAYRGRSRNSCSSLQDLDKNKLLFRMLHGRNTLSEEKKLLKEINPRQQKAPSSCFSLDELNDAIYWWFDCRERWDWMFNYKGGDDQERIIKEKNQLTCLKEKAISTAAVKGKLWTSLGSKQAIHDKVEIIGTELDGIMTTLQLRKLHDEKRLKKIREDIKSLQKQLAVARHIENETYECVLQLSKLLDGESYYRSLIKNARKLAQKKDVATLEELSREQVDRFFSQYWNNNKAFREEYEKKRFGLA